MHLCRECLRKEHLEVAHSCKGGLSVFYVNLGDKDINTGDVICSYGTSNLYNHMASWWHKQQGTNVKCHALSFTTADGMVMVSNAEHLECGV